MGGATTAAAPARRDGLGVDLARARHERRAWAVAALTLVATAVEAAGGWWTRSAALAAEGLHMGAHVSAFVLAGAGYLIARRLAGTRRWRAAALAPDGAALLNGLLLLGLGAGLAVESWDAWRTPRSVAFGAALDLAVFGLAVNVASALLLRGGHIDPPTQDLNLRAVYLHALGDGAVAVLAIVGLVAGRYLGWRWSDALAGGMGAVLVLVLGARVTLGSLDNLAGGGRRERASRRERL